MIGLPCSIIFIAISAGLCSGDCSVPSPTTAGGAAFSPRTLCSGDLIFEDTFDNLDLHKWQHEITLSGGGNWEFEYYLNNRSNSFAVDGNLHIHPNLLADDYGEGYLSSGTLDVNGGSPADICTSAANYGCTRTGTSENYINPIRSARLRTAESFYFKYGTVEVRAKMPAGDWLWPAIWLMPRFNAYGNWPSSGEIDLLESRGNKNLVDAGGANVGTQLAASTLHWGPSSIYNQYLRTHYEKTNSAGYDTDFHTYKVVWNADGLSFYVDDEQFGSVNPPEGGFWQLGQLDGNNIDNPWQGGTKMAPFDQEFYLIINLAIGGVNFFSDDYVNPGGKPWSNASPTSVKDFWLGKNQWLPTWYTTKESSDLVVDYVRVYAA